jgi:hypothetical protein
MGPASQTEVLPQLVFAECGLFLRSLFGHLSRNDLDLAAVAGAGAAADAYKIHVEPAGAFQK